MNDAQDTKKQSKTYAFKKAVAFSAIHFVVGMTLAYVLTGQWAVALGVALIEPVVNAAIIYGHARWESGRETGPGLDWKTSLA